VFIDPHRQHVEFSGFGPRRLHTWFEPGLVSVRTEDGTEIDRRRDPRASFPQDAAAAWDDIQVVYFAAYGEFSGLLFPTRRSVTARRADGAAGNGPILVSIDFGDITVR
jgi:hypothetical protein